MFKFKLIYLNKKDYSVYLTVNHLINIIMKKFNLFTRQGVFSLFGFLLVAFLFSSCEKESVSESLETANFTASVSPAAMKGAESIGEIAITNEDFEELVKALSYVDAELDTGLVPLFVSGTDQYTVFAPTDDAFGDLYDALGITSIEELPATLVRDVLLYHVTDGRRFSNSVVPPKNPKEIETLLGESFYVNSDRSIDAIGNEGSIVVPDISASNGVIHIISSVLLPIE